ncbi:sigma factor [Streptomyces sp. NPDC001450]
MQNRRGLRPRIPRSEDDGTVSCEERSCSTTSRSPAATRSPNGACRRVTTPARPIHRRRSALVYGPAQRSLGDAGKAQDVAQQVFLGVWRALHGYRPERGPPAGRPAGSPASPGAQSPTP